MLTDAEKRLRRMERLRLIAFLLKGGALRPEPIPPDGVAWTRLSRSGHPFNDRAVKRLIKRGCVVRRQRFGATVGDDGSLRLVAESA